MGKQLAITVDGKHKKGKKLFITDNNIKQRKVKKAFYTVAGVHKLVYSSGTIWQKYSCDVDSTRINTYKDVDTNDYGSIGDSLTIESDYMYTASSYYFHERIGWNLESPFFVVQEYATASSQIGKYIGQHYNGSKCDWIGQIISVDGDLSSPSWTVTVKLVALCELVDFEITYEYSQGSTSYGTVEADDGALPESGTLIEGSVEDGYCVMRINDTYYYYTMNN